MINLLRIFGLIILGTIGAIIGANAFSTIWGWFIVPLGVVAIAPLTAYGITCLFSILTAPMVIMLSSRESSDNEAGAETNLIASMVAYGFTVLMAYIALSVFG